MNDLAELTKFAMRYAKAWCSQNSQSVAAFFAERGSISINNGPAAVGRAAIAKEAQAFMTTFPDMIVTMDKVAHDEEGTKFHWTLTGTNTGPSGTGKRVCISGTRRSPKGTKPGSSRLSWRFFPTRRMRFSNGAKECSSRRYGWVGNF
jgi:hypothetical protein